ncbi:MAG: response regulator [Deltaproteobacteria bacterium]|nr:response regulator [Deltaproteobacteria bacterium]
MPDRALGRILIADDEETFLLATADLLRREGYECVCAPDAFEASKVLKAEPFDLLIADIKMPGNPDLELIRQLPELYEGLQVILVTGYPSVRSAIEAIQLPVAAYLLKPVDFEELLAQAKLAVERYQSFRAVKSTRERLQSWKSELDLVEQTLGASSTPAQKPVDAFVQLTMRNIVASLTDLQHMTQALATQQAAREACQLMNCPRGLALAQALKEAVDTLERTKRAFKSKELGDLRKTLEEVLKAYA